LRTPLNPLLLHVQMLLRAARAGTLPTQPPEKLLASLEVCEQEVKRFGRLVDDLLDVSRIAAGLLDLRPEEVDLAALARDVVRRFGPVLDQAGCPVRLAADAPAV